MGNAGDCGTCEMSRWALSMKKCGLGCIGAIYKPMVCCVLLNWSVLAVIDGVKLTMGPTGIHTCIGAPVGDER